MNNTNQNKRQIYLWGENKVFYDCLPNKSKLINLLIRKYRQEMAADGDSDTDRGTEAKDS